MVVCKRLAFKFPTYRQWENFLRGLLANMHESRFSDLNHPLLAPVLFSMPGGWLNVMPAAKVSSEHLATWISHAENDRYREMLFNIVEEKVDSVGLIDGQVKAIDYGS